MLLITQYRFPPLLLLFSAGVLDDLVDESAVLDVALDLFWDGTFLGVFICTLLGWEHDVDRGAFAGEDLRVQTLAAEVDGCAVDLVEEDGGDDAVDLQGELGRLDDFQAADEGVDDDGETGAVVDGDGVCLVGDLDDGLVAAADQDRVVLLSRDLDDFAGVVEVLDEPLVGFQLLTRWLLGTHALRLGLLARRSG